MGMMGSSTFDVNVLGYNMADADMVANQIKEMMEKTEGLRDIKLSRDDYTPQLKVCLQQGKTCDERAYNDRGGYCCKEQINGFTSSISERRERSMTLPLLTLLNSELRLMI